MNYFEKGTEYANTKATDSLNFVSASQHKIPLVLQSHTIHFVKTFCKISSVLNAKYFTAQSSPSDSLSGKIRIKSCSIIELLSST